MTAQDDVTAITSRLDHMSVAVQNLASSVHTSNVLAAGYNREKHRRTTVIRNGVVALVVLIAGFLVYGGLQVHRVTSIGKTNREGVTRVLDCTTPGHACYDQGQAAQAAAIAQLVHAQAVATWCAARALTLDAVNSCLTAYLGPDTGTGRATAP